MMSRLLSPITKVSLILLLTAGMATAAAKTTGLETTGKADLKSAGPLAFGPEGVLFVGDPAGAALFAIGVEPATGSFTFRSNVEGVDVKLAALLGIKPADLLIHDMVVQPGRGDVYLSASRGRGPDAEPVLARVDQDGKISVVALDKIAYSRISLKNAPNPDAKDRRGNSLRLESITDLHYLDGRAYIAGLSNEEFASKLRAVAFPFASDDLSTSVEIYHGAHGAYETRSPVRTFVPFVVNGEPHLLAAYQCTPLVTFPVSQINAGSKLRGTTVAELGNMNRPLDIIAYEKDGKKYLLLSNTNRGVMKIATENIEKQQGITEKIGDKAGLSYETISTLKGVEQLDKLGNDTAVMLVRTDEKTLNLETIPLP